MKPYLLLFGMMSACSLLVQRFGVERCEEAPARCDGNVLVVCNDGVTFEEDCGASACDAVAAACALCGDAIVNPGEQCDDGNNIPGDGCSDACALENCGDGIINPGEQCDDNNNLDGDGCSAVCTLEKCGDGFLNAGEECDDGNLTPQDVCDQLCRVEGNALGEIEPNNSFSDANNNVFPPDLLMIGTLSGTDTEDIFRVTGTFGTVKVSLYGGGGIGTCDNDTRLDIFLAPVGTLFASGVPSGATGCPVATFLQGDFYVRVQQVSGSPSYQVVVDF